ncbi:hypothetical protein [Escherichia coli]|uniref:hypothetical protein n=1 Tax=Escherichia coli TaxID=562 RepID=UPI002FCD687A
MHGDFISRLIKAEDYGYEQKSLDTQNAANGGEMGLVAILVPFFLVGCVSLDKARQLFDTASQVCEIVDGVRQCLQN